jgi:lipopolysaccharide biosynthesis protein
MRDLARRTAVGALSATRLATPVGRLLVPRSPQPAPEATVTQVRPLPTTGDVVVLAHFDPHGDFAEAATYYLDAFRSAGFDAVVVSTVPEHARLVDQVGDRAAAVVTRPNIGFDFLSWAAGIALLRAAGAEPRRLVLTNTSMYGPMEPLAGLLDRTFALGADVVGLTESREFRPHVQSYFLGFTGAAWRSERFAAYWDRIRPAQDKWGTILAHEQRWAEDLAAPGRPARALVTSREMATPRNPLTFTWRRLLDLGVPLVKRSLFLANPDHVDMRGWQDELARRYPAFDTGVVERDALRLTGRVPDAR